MTRFALTAALLLVFALPAAADGMTTKGPGLVVSSTEARAFTCRVAIHGQGSYVGSQVEMGGVNLDQLGQTGTGLGALVGCDVVRNGFLLGIAADYTWDRAAFQASAMGMPIIRLPFGNQGSVVGRFGTVVNGGTKLYGLGGITNAGDAKGTMGGFVIPVGNKNGRTLGGGIEIPITGPIYAGLEYRNVAFEREVNTMARTDTHENIVRASIGINF